MSHLKVFGRRSSVKGHLWMSAKERHRKSVFDRVKADKLSLVSAAALLDLSYRQTLRAFRRFKSEGDAGLVHRSRGRKSNRAAPAKYRKRIVARYKKRYEGFGPTLAAEKLTEEGLAVNAETLRRWLIEEKQWTRQRSSPKHRSQRERKAHFGELVQIDGSHHRWFGQDRPACCLVNLVDDATGTTLSFMAEEETTIAVMRAMWMWIEQYGIPKALYADRKSVFFTDREPTLEEQLADETPMTAFGTACAKLGIHLEKAYSPQAKGRVERNHGVYQDRFVKELALRRITTIDAANRLLANGFVDGLNKRFAKAPQSDEDFHRPLDKDINLADVLCFEEWRTVHADWTIRFQNAYYQILETNRPLPRHKDKICVRTRLDGTILLLAEGRFLDYEKLSPHQVQRRTTKTAAPKPKPPNTNTSTSKRKPARTPWRQGVTVMFADTKKGTK
jgi:molybdenum-dependent DNA-binding transcriptional regulator ModE